KFTSAAGTGELDFEPGTTTVWNDDDRLVPILWAGAQVAFVVNLRNPSGNPGTITFYLRIRDSADCSVVQTIATWVQDASELPTDEGDPYAFNTTIGGSDINITGTQYLVLE